MAVGRTLHRRFPAIEAAKNALQNNQACRDLFSKENGLDLLNKLGKKGKIKIGDTGVPKTLSSTGRLKDAAGLGGVTKGGTIYINPNSKLTSGTYAAIVNGVYNNPVGTFGGLSPTDALAALIVHETLHVSKDFPPETNPEQSLLHSSDVIDACFKKTSP